MKFQGVIPALVTPLNKDESINVPVLHQLIGDLINQRADGFYVGGATGEGLALRPEERKILTEESIKAVGGRVPTIIQVASCDYSVMLDLARHAEASGADAISATAPLFFKYDTDDVYNYYKRLADAVHIPVMIYYNPNVGFPMNADFAARVFEIDNVTAIKWTSSNYYEMLRLKDLTHGEMNIINGPDEMLLMGLNAGADGGIGTTYNFMMENIRGVYDCFHAGKAAEAQEWQTKANRVIRTLITDYMGIPATKAILEAMGYAVGDAAFPMKHYTAEEKAKIVADMRAAGLKI